MSELAAGPQVDTNGSPRKLRILGILFVSIAAVTSPVLMSSLLYTADGLSVNGVVTHLFVPLADVLTMLLIVLVARRTGAAGRLDLVWFRLRRLDLAAIVLLPAAALVLMLLVAVAMNSVGLNVPVSRMFLPEGKSLAFFVALALRIVLVVPVLEELFWRGFVQRSLERVAGPLPALLGQAVLFAAAHLAPFGRFGPALALGLVAGLWRWRRRTLIPIILAHMILNGLYFAGQWAHWWDYSRVRVATDYVSQMNQASCPPECDPNADAHPFYERGFQAAVGMPEALATFRRGLPRDWSEEAFEQLRNWVTANEEALDHMAQGAQKPCYCPLYTGDGAMLAGMPQSVGARHLAFALDTRIKLRAFDGEDDLLLADAATLYRFARHFDGRKVLSHQILGVSIRTLLAGTLRGILAKESLLPQTLASLQQQLEQPEDEDSGVLDFTLERCIWLDGIQRMFTDDGDGQGRIPRVTIAQWKGLPRPFLLLIDSMTPGQNADLLGLDRRQTTDCAEEFLAQIQVAAGRTPWELHSEPNGLQGTLEGLARRNAYVGLLGTACLGVLDLPWRARTDLAALVATLAAIRYETDRGEYPDSLAQLVESGFLRRVPQDAYSNGPLVYKRTPGGFLLYSLGMDFDDDGGVPSQWGQGEQGGDQVFWPVR
ncbi:MAG: CPBP family intramembrane metalloprotease [Phycisphaerae bacterium]|nr:CPBP family intramembrane metalloprotease [Phycisphaerae bacterium]